MSRKARKFNSHLIPDPRFNSIIVAKCINHIMLDGKKALASKILYSALSNLEKISKEKKVSILDLFVNVIESLKPSIRMRSRRVGGSTYQVPCPLREKESEMIAIKWLVDAARSTSGKSMESSLTDIIIETIEGRGTAIKKKEEMHRTADANKAFAHFA
ncbi:MAG: small subunit ribosomal protein S7 [Candidatus Deianiraeaceae bacterium]|jgi:small subunit ribosomal protein S7